MRENGAANRPNGNGAPAAAGTERRPRRVVLLNDAPDGPAERVLAEYQGADATGARLHADLRRLAEEHLGRCVAAEWLGPRGWTRFLWRHVEPPR